jgi:hypothetical protein
MEPLRGTGIWQIAAARKYARLADRQRGVLIALRVSARRAGVYVRIFVRALCLVTLVACNTRQLALGHLGGAAAIGSLISFLWWTNSAKDRPDVPYANVAYGLGGGVGTLCGYFLAGIIG